MFFHPQGHWRGRAPVMGEEARGAVGVPVHSKDAQRAAQIT